MNWTHRTDRREPAVDVLDYLDPPPVAPIESRQGYSDLGVPRRAGPNDVPIREIAIRGDVYAIPIICADIADRIPSQDDWLAQNELAFGRRRRDKYLAVIPGLGSRWRRRPGRSRYASGCSRSVALASAVGTRVGALAVAVAKMLPAISSSVALASAVGTRVGALAVAVAKMAPAIRASVALASVVGVGGSGVGALAVMVAKMLPVIRFSRMASASSMALASAVGTGVIVGTGVGTWAQPACAKARTTSASDNCLLFIVTSNGSDDALIFDATALVRCPVAQKLLRQFRDFPVGRIVND